MTRIALLVPTRGRPEQCRRMVESVYRTCAERQIIAMPRILIGVLESEYHHYVNECEHRLVTFYKVPEWPTVQSWNYLAQKALENKYTTHFMLGADDMIFATPGWDTALIEHYEALKEKCHVYALQDSRDKDGTPHIIATREYVEAMGYFLPPIFLHWNVDVWTVSIAKANGVFTKLDDFLLIHDKPSDTGAGDETHNRIRRAGWHERDKDVNDTCQHFLEYEKKRLDEYLRNKEGMVDLGDGSGMQFDESVLVKYGLVTKQ